MLKITSVTLEETQISRLEQVAQGEERSVSYLVRQAINQYLKKKAPS